MGNRRWSVATVSHFLHGYFIWFLIGSYIVAAVWPAPVLGLTANDNNGTGLVLASMVRGDCPRVFPPVIFYNLVQHLAAGTVDFLLARRTAGPGRSG